MLKFSFVHLRRSLLEPLAWEISRRKLHGLLWQRQDTAGIVQAAIQDYKGRGFYGSIRPTQRMAEISALACLVQAAKPRVLVEIGTHLGGTLFIWVRTNPQLELAVSIDLPGGEFGGGYDARRVKLYREFAADRPQTCMEFLRADSHAPSSLATLKQMLDGRSIDFLYVDGDHTYKGVRMDFEMYSPLVRQGGLIAFHDIVTSGSSHEVCRFWNEIKPAYRHEEFVEDPRGNMGIGVVHV